MILFPVRHHSPVCALRLAEHIRAVRPRLILIEGPCDATPLIPLLLAADTRPPVAILAYFPADRLADGEGPRSSVWPLCAYSPEYVALQVGREVGAALRFFDMPAGAFLDAPQASDAPEEASPDLWQAIAARFGFDDYEEFWECRFEMADGDLREAMLELGALVRAYGSDARNAEREAWMRAEVARALADGYDPAKVLIVCGAAHASVLVPPFSPIDGYPRTGARPARLTIVPFSYPRLSEQFGYGAGNRAPAYYQMVWEHRGDFHRATQEALIRTADALHRAGYAISLADAIEANRLARTLAALREKPAPGLLEVRDAAQACYGRSGIPVDGVLWPLMVGEAVGAVSAQVERTALQQEFYDTVARLRLPCTDSPQERRLYLTQPADVEASVFLHRLTVADIPFGQVEAVQMVGRGRPEADVDDAARWLGQLREKWTLRWTPLTDIRLVEASVEGDSLAQVCTRRFRRALAQARRVADAADVLLRIVLTQIEPLYAEGLAACERTSSADDDLPSLAHAAYHLHSLIKYGASRAMAAEAIETLLSKVYIRASLLLPGAAAVADEAVPPLRDALIILYTVARQSPALDATVLALRLRRTAESDRAHPTLAGLACALLFFCGELPEAELTMFLSRRLSPGEEPLVGAQFIEGLLALNRAVLLRHPAIVAWLNHYLQAISAERFVAVLPILRRAFADLSSAEVDYLLATLARLLNLSCEQARAAGPPVTAEEIAAIDAELGDVLRDMG